MVTLPGSGIVFAGTVKADDVGRIPQAACSDVVPAVGIGQDHRMVLVANTCCVDGFNIVNAGFGKGPTKGKSQDHLKTFHDTLTRAKNDDLLLEYCVMMWGLTEKQSKDLFTKMKEQYNLQEAPKGK